MSSGFFRPIPHLVLLLFCSLARADVAVLTQHNDSGRTGANLNETLLNTSNVNTNQFGMLFTRAVDDLVYAQPLVMTNVDLGTNGVHNIVIVATADDSVYAFDADSPSVATPYWHVSFLGPNIVAPTKFDYAAGDAGFCPFFSGSGNIGVIGTPVIDPVSGTLFLVAHTKEKSSSGTNFVQKLHALDLRTGSEQPNSPVTISATYQTNTNYDGTNGLILFNPFTQCQRSGLTLVNSTIYISWASFCDFYKYHGWIIGYDAATLQQVAVYNDTPDGVRGGIWMGGSAPAADEQGNLYVSTGNGSTGDAASPTNVINRGDSFLKLTPDGTNLDVVSWFTPFNWVSLEMQDKDLGTAGLLLVPGTQFALSGGKQGTIYLADRDNLGGLSQENADTNVVQSFVIVTNGSLSGTPVWWDGPNGSYAYLWPVGGRLQQLRLDPTNLQFILPQYSQGRFSTSHAPGGILSLSANGTNAGTGIVWASTCLTPQDPTFTFSPGVLIACDAENVTNTLWFSAQVPTRDNVGFYAKFVPPTIANGKVYMATFTNRLDVYGLLPPSLSVSLANSNIVVSWPTNNYPGYVLQSSPDLTPGSWISITNGIVITNGQYQFLQPNLGTSFFRLRL